MADSKSDFDELMAAPVAETKNSAFDELMSHSEGAVATASSTQELGKSNPAPSLLDKRLPFIQEQAQKSFTENPEIFSSADARAKYYDAIVHQYGQENGNKIRASLMQVDPYLKQQVGGQLLSALNPLGETIPSALEAAAGGITTGGKEMIKAGAMLEKNGNDPKALLHGAVGLGHIGLGVLSATQPELAVFNIASGGLQETAPEVASKLLSPVSSTIEKKYKEAGIPVPVWKNDLGQVADFAINAAAFLGIHFGGKAINELNTQNAIKDFQKGLDDLTPEKINEIYNTTQQTKQAYASEKQSGATSANYADWLGGLKVRADAENARQQSNLNKALARKTAPEHFNDLGQVSLSKPLSQLPDGISVSYQGKDGHIARDESTNEIIFKDGAGKQTILGGGGDQRSAGELGLAINEGKYADEHGKYFVEKTSDGHTVYRVNKNGDLKPVYEGENANIERKDAIIKKALERSNDETSLFDLNKRSQAIEADLATSVNPTVAAILQDKKKAIDDQANVLQEKIDKENISQATSHVMLSLFENHRNDIEGSMKNLSDESKQAIKPDLEKIKSQIKNLQTHAVRIENKIPEEKVIPRTEEQGRARQKEISGELDRSGYAIEFDKGGEAGNIIVSKKGEDIALDENEIPEKLQPLANEFANIDFEIESGKHNKAIGTFGNDEKAILEVKNEYRGYKLATKEIEKDHYVTYGRDANGNEVSAESTSTDPVSSMEKIQKLIDQSKKLKTQDIFDDHEISRKLADDEAEARLRTNQFTSEENPEQEPGVTGIERTGENAQGTSDKELLEGLNKADQIIDDATGVVMKPLSELHTDEASFQNREKLDEDNVENIVNHYSPSEFDPIVTFKKADGKDYVLSGHHRFEAARRLDLKKVKTTPLTYPAGHAHAGEIVPASDVAYASKWAKEEANVNRKAEDLLERAKIYRKQREEGIKESQIEKNADKERGNKKFVLNLSALNPKGKVIAALNALSKATDRVSIRESERMADWIGEVKRNFPELTDAHENEMYDFLMSDHGIKSKSDFAAKIQTKVFGLQAGEPLNIKNLEDAGKSQNRIDWENTRDDLRGKISELNAQLKPNKETRWNQIKQDMIAKLSKGSDKESLDAAVEKFNTPEVQKVYEQKVESLTAELKKVQADLGTHLLKENDLIAADKSQGNLFDDVADFIRKGKIGDDIAMASVPFVKEVWNGALDVLAHAVRTTGKIVEAIEIALAYIRDSEWYKALSEADKKDAEKRFEDYANNLSKSHPTLFPLSPAAKTQAKINSKVSNLNPGVSASMMRKSTILTEKTIKQKSKYTFRKFYEGYIKHIEDISGNAKEALKNAGGEETVMLKDISNKSSGKASLKIKEQENKIFKGLTQEDLQSLGEIIEAKRAIQLDEIYDNRGIERLKHQSGFTSEFYNNVLVDMKNADPTKFSELEKRADDYFTAQKELLDLKKENGLLNQAGYDKLLEQSLYSPRLFIQHLNELGGNINKGKTISVNDAGIKKLDEGSEGLMVKDPRLLLAMSTAKTFDIIAKNDAAKSLFEFAKANPENGVAQVRKVMGKTKNGDPIYEDVPTGKDVVSAMVDGNKKDIVVSKEFADEWVSSDPAISAALGEAVQWLTGSTLLRYAATGVNPLFALANAPRDMAYIYFTSDVYSSHVPIFIKQIHEDMAKVASDVFARKGRYKEFIDEGGSIELLTHQGRLYTGKAENEGINRVSHVLGYVGETSELMTRIAMRERGIKNSIAKFEKKNDRAPNPDELKQIKIKATYDAINQLDFSQGGDWTKALNKFIPYTNAAFQATRGLFRAARRDPKQFAYKASQLAVIAGGLAVYNLSQEGYDQVSDDEKARNYIIMLPGMVTLDEAGNKKYSYIKIPKSQESYFISSLAEQTAEYALTGKKPDRQTWLAIQQQAPPIPFLTQNPPIMEAIRSYQSNYDTYFDKKLWLGSESIPNELQFYKNTPEAYRKIGEATGMSPEKLRGAVQKVVPGIEKNPFITIPVKSFALAAEELGIKEQTNLNKSFLKNMEDVLGGLYKKYIGETYPPGRNNLFKLKEITSIKYRMQMDRSIQELRRRGEGSAADEVLREYDAQVDELRKLTNASQGPAEIPKTKSGIRKAGVRK